MQNIVTAQEVQGMVSHWLATPVNGYLGSSYGNDLAALLQRPMSAGLADNFLQKMITDIPILGALPEGSVNIYLVDKAGYNDKKELTLEILGDLIPLGLVNA
jgi:hypothetical protein